jgi:serine phosphatase RsbU (regulator of sigma subunit)
MSLLLADALTGPGVKYVGILVAAPFLAAVFARARVVVLVGTVTLLLAWVYGELRGVGDTSTQWVRLVAIIILTAVASVSAKVRWRVDEQLTTLTSVADAAQRAVLRPIKPGPEVEAAVRYVAAQEASRIGGDIYDVTSTPWGTRVLLGDVRGKGLEAVALGSDVLGAWRYLAQREVDLGVVVRELDAVVSHSGGEEDFVTAVVLEVNDKGITVYNCGHPDPVVVGSKGARFLRTGERALPLGMGTDARATTVGMHPWTQLLLYTDGLSEARDEAGEFFDPLEKAPAMSPGALEDWLDGLFRSLGAHVSGLDDDVAALVLRVRGGQETAGSSRAA